MSTSEYQDYVGVAWVTEAHPVVIPDATRAPVADQVVEKTGTAWTALADELAGRVGGEGARIAAMIEVPRGPVVETLLERGC